MIVSNIESRIAEHIVEAAKKPVSRDCDCEEFVNDLVSVICRYRATEYAWRAAS